MSLSIFQSRFLFGTFSLALQFFRALLSVDASCVSECVHEREEGGEGKAEGFLLGLGLKLAGGEDCFHCFLKYLGTFAAQMLQVKLGSIFLA